MNFVEGCVCVLDKNDIHLNQLGNNRVIELSMKYSISVKHYFSGLIVLDLA